MTSGDRRGCLQRLLAVACAAGTATLASGRPSAPPPALPALRKGVNLTHWFEYEQGQAVSADELVQLRRVGFDHVRIPVDPVVGLWQPEAATPRLAFMPALRSAIENALTAGLDVVFDLHLEPATKTRIEQRPALEPALSILWSWIGRRLADLPPSRLAFELYNEPPYYGRHARRWPPLQQRLLAALREQAPRHLVLLSGNEGGSLQGLRALPPVADGAVAHVFHHYAPFLFTHQGAHWLDSRYTTAGLRSDLRYPASAQGTVEPGLSRWHPRAASELAAYAGTDGHAARVRADIDAAAAHGREQRLRLVCTEFGAIRAGVDPASRYRWIGDVRSALEAQGIGWSVWDYADIFGITTDAGAVPPPTGQQRRAPRVIEAAALQALGLAAAIPAPGR